MICNISEASLHLGFRSRSTLQRLVQKGFLDGYRVPNNGREVLLELEPAGQPSLRETVQAMTQYRPGSPLWAKPRHRPAAAAPLEQLSDEALAAYCDEHLSDEAMAAAMAPIDRWANELQTPDWELVAKLANEALDCSAWGPPPWPAVRWSTLAMVLSLAEEEAAAGG